MFTDALNLPIDVAASTEAGALGVALCAGVGAGVYASLEEAVEQSVRIIRTHLPDPAGHARLNQSYSIYMDIIRALDPVWQEI
jgi:L-xylulokinase